MWLSRALRVGRDAIIPLPDRLSQIDAANAATRLKDDLDKIDATPWNRISADVAVDEARRLNDAETDRRKSADAKASIYLALMAGLISVVISLQGAIWDGKVGYAPAWLNICGLSVAVFYLAGGGYWAFQTLRVAVVNRVDVGDLMHAWRAKSPRRQLVIELLSAVRLNREPVNQKITTIRMAQSYVWRTFITLIFMFAANVVWAIVDEAIGLHKGQESWAALVYENSSNENSWEQTVKLASLQACKTHALRELRSLPDPKVAGYRCLSQD